jgi:hypothetical protein
MQLIKEGYVHKRRLCAVGCSAGGLLVGAVINMLPDLFAAAVLKVHLWARTSFFYAVCAHISFGQFLFLFSSLLAVLLLVIVLLGFDFNLYSLLNRSLFLISATQCSTSCAIYSYSPYNILSPEMCYPPVLVTASYNDTRFLRSHLFYYWEDGRARGGLSGQGAGGITAGHARTRAVGAAKDWGRRRVVPIGGPCSALAGAGH